MFLFVFIFNRNEILMIHQNGLQPLMDEQEPKIKPGTHLILKIIFGWVTLENSSIIYFVDKPSRY